MTSSAGRTYRSRTPANVLEEISVQHRSHDVRQFVFTDLKLNSNIDMWRAIAAGVQHAAPGSSWIGAVHAESEAESGLSPAELRDAAQSGCVRLTTGLESGSQRLVDIMRKGTRIERTSAMLHAASEAGISMRCTMIMGHPGETSADVVASADFLARHRDVIERVSLNRFQLMTGTALHRSMQRHPARHGAVRIVGGSPESAQVEHTDPTLYDRHHRRATDRLLTEAFQINRRPLSPRAGAFEGVM